MKKIILFAVLFGIFPFSTHAGVQCSDVKYENENYHAQMAELARLAGLPDGYISRYHEDVVKYLCQGDEKEVAGLIDNGFVKQSEVAAIRKVLGSREPAGSNYVSKTGKRYGYYRQKFSDMGLCSACADNVAQYCSKKPASQCGILARKALAGNPQAIETLQSFPDFCKWKY